LWIPNALLIFGVLPKDKKKREEIQDRYSEALEYMMKGDLLKAQDIFD